MLPKDFVATLIFCATTTRLQVHQRNTVIALGDQGWRIGSEECDDDFVGRIPITGKSNGFTAINKPISGPWPWLSLYTTASSMNWYHESEQRTLSSMWGRWSSPACRQTAVKTMKGTIHLVMMDPPVADYSKYPLPIAEKGSFSSNFGTCLAIQAVKVLLLGPGKALYVSFHG